MYRTDVCITVKNKPLLTEHPVIKEIAKAHDVNEAQILVSWGVDRGYSVIVKSVKGGRSSAL
jgi:diketogulonate reductase-like aldo/keto reductase